MHRPDVFKFFAEHHWVASVDRAAREGGRRLGDLPRSQARRSSARRSGASSCVGDVELSFEGRARLAQLAARRRRRSSADRRPASSTGCGACRRETIEVTVHERSTADAPELDAGSCARAGSASDRDVEERDDGIRVATPLRMLFGHGRPVQPVPLRAGGRGRVAQGARHAGRGPGVPRAHPAFRARPVCRRMDDVAGEDARRASARPRAAWSSTSWRSSSGSACRLRSASTRWSSRPVS